MNVAVVSFYWQKGGAARCARSLSLALRDAGHTVTAFSTERVVDRGILDGLQAKPTSRLLARAIWPRLMKHWQRSAPLADSSHHFSRAPRIGALDHALGSARFDAVSIHWFQQGLLSLSRIRSLGGSAFITGHDRWLTTGGCHAMACSNNSTGCGTCPALRSPSPRDISREEFRRKLAFASDGLFHYISPSHFLDESVGTVLRIPASRRSVIPNGIDPRSFFPVDRPSTRRCLGLPDGTRYVLFVSTGGTKDKNKGFDLLDDSLAEIPAGQRPVILLVGDGGERHQGEFQSPRGNRMLTLGTVSDELLMRMVYSAADVTCVPSRMENLPYVAMESLACGTPVCGFRIGGIPEIVSGEDGYLAQPYDCRELAAGITAQLTRPSSDLQRGMLAERAVRRFGISTFLASYARCFSHSGKPDPRNSPERA